MTNFKRLAPRDLPARHGAAGIVIAAAVTLGAWTSLSAVHAQGTPPLPTPGTAPAPSNTAPPSLNDRLQVPPGTAPAPPATPPGAPGAPGEEARARAAAMAAKANIDVTEAWTRATAG